MGLFSFLFDQQAPTGGGFVSADTLPKSDPNAPIDPGMSAPTHLTAAAGPDINPAMAPDITGNLGAGQDLGEVRTLPHMATQPGLLSRLKAPDANGMTFGDKLALSGMMLRDNADPSTVMEYQNSRLKQAQFQRQLALQQRGNQAFRAAYQGGKFNPQVYASVMGDALDPDALAKLSTTFNPKKTLQDGFIVTTDPIGGGLTIDGQRPMNYGEQNSAEQAAEAHRHNTVDEGQGSQRIAEDVRSHRVSEGIAGGNLGVAQAHLGLDQQNAGFEHQKFGASQNPGVPVVTNPTDYARLPKGSSYVAPDGSLRHKQ